MAWTPASAATSAHPRRCGENGSASRRAVAPHGSSPQVRGKRAHACSFARLCRLIPAPAGKTPYTHASPDTRAAHPRRCGENSVSSSANRSIFGSSPQVRGKHFVFTRVLLPRRLIPAGAGKTQQMKECTSHPWAHPRRCGENLVKVFNSRASAGSSPQVRGKQPSGYCGRERQRLIPAGAGKTL